MHKLYATLLALACCGCPIGDSLGSCSRDIDCVDSELTIGEFDPSVFYDCNTCGLICESMPSSNGPVVRRTGCGGFPGGCAPPPCEERPLDDACIEEFGDPLECPQRLVDDPCDTYCIDVCQLNPEICFDCHLYPNLCSPVEP